ncbi:MAG: transglycosylase SLT domain-containing protein [Kofleriaceae bacterium]|nr:transglycosylase SLT domain-containing protein [Kofleriaceae bacterium]
MKTDEFPTLTDEQLVTASGAMSASARYIMMHESGGSATAGHLHKQGRGDGTPGNHSSAFGAFQMIEATRKQYMGRDYQSTDFNKQYSAATRYVNDRYGGWDNAAAFWRRHRWY